MTKEIVHLACKRNMLFTHSIKYRMSANSEFTVHVLVTPGLSRAPRMDFLVGNIVGRVRVNLRWVYLTCFTIYLRRKH